jgi:hypothetical protein
MPTRSPRALILKVTGWLLIVIDSSLEKEEKGPARPAHEMEELCKGGRWRNERVISVIDLEEGAL